MTSIISIWIIRMIEAEEVIITDIVCPKKES